MSSTTSRLQYEISDWSQASRCLSNNDTNVKIGVCTLLNNESITGTLIQVYHDLYGVLFAAFSNCSGSMISDSLPSGQPLYCLTTDEILTRLARFGFDITYTTKTNISGDQLTYLETLLSMGMDKLNRVTVETGDTDLPTEEYIVAFDSEHNYDMLSFNTMMYKSTFLEKLNSGTVLNITSTSKKQNYTWDWLTFVANISDILDENSIVKEIDDDFEIVDDDGVSNDCYDQLPSRSDSETEED